MYFDLTEKFKIQVDTILFLAKKLRFRMFFQLPAQCLSYYKFSCILKRINYVSKHFSECIFEFSERIFVLKSTKCSEVKYRHDLLSTHKLMLDFV